MSISVSKPLPLTGAFNVRDLGGYPTATGATRYRQFLRADSLHALSEADKRFLYDYGVRCIIDMRGGSELARALFKAPDNIFYVNLPLLDHINSNELEDEFPSSLRELYIDGLLKDSKEQIGRVLHTAAAYPEDCVLFNCSAGKDRTGMIAMLLLKLGGVPNEVIVKDYSASEHYMKQVFAEQLARLRRMGMTNLEHLFRSEPADMEAALAYFDGAYASCREYLEYISLPEDDIRSLFYKMTGRGKAADSRASTFARN